MLVPRVQSWRGIPSRKLRKENVVNRLQILRSCIFYYAKTPVAMDDQAILLNAHPDINVKTTAQYPPYMNPAPLTQKMHPALK
jgi:hypothetical protein